jgi:hypothetical protein
MGAPIVPVPTKPSRIGFYLSLEAKKLTRGVDRDNRRPAAKADFDQIGTLSLRGAPHATKQSRPIER